jgi:hypothetical protein
MIRTALLAIAVCCAMAYSRAQPDVFHAAWGLVGACAVKWCLP